MTNDELMKTYGATHKAILPDDSEVYYQVNDEVTHTNIWIWSSHHGIWSSPGSIPYSLINLDEEDESL